MQTDPKFNADRSEGQGTFQKYRNNATHVPWDLSNETSDLLSLAVTIKGKKMTAPPRTILVSHILLEK